MTAPADNVEAAMSIVYTAAIMQAVSMGEAKANGAFDKTFISAMLAGAYVGFGGMLALSVGGACPELMAHNPGLQKLVLGGFGLPTGLLIVRSPDRLPRPAIHAHELQPL